MVKNILDKLKTKELNGDYNSDCYDFIESKEFINKVIENSTYEDAYIEYEDSDEDLHQSVLFIEGIKGRFYIQVDDDEIFLNYEGGDKPIDD